MTTVIYIISYLLTGYLVSVYIDVRLNNKRRGLLIVPVFLWPLAIIGVIINLTACYVMPMLAKVNDVVYRIMGER